MWRQVLVLPSNVSTLTSWISTDFIYSSEFLLMIYPSKGSVKQQLVVVMIPSNLNLGMVLVEDYSRFSCEI